MATLFSSFIDSCSPSGVLDGLELRVLEIAPHPELAAESTLLVTAIGVFAARVPPAVDADHAGTDSARHAQPACQVAAPYAPVEPVDGIVRDPDGLVLAAEPLHGHHRPQDLLLGALHLVADAGKDRRIHA